MPHDHSKSSVPQNPSRAAAHNPNAGGISRPAVMQRQPVIQLYGEPDTEVANALIKKNLILGMITAGNYKGAIENYKTLKFTLKEVYTANWTNDRKTFKRHIESMLAYVKEVIAAFHVSVQLNLQESAIFYQDLSVKYESLYNNLYDQIGLQFTAGGDVAVLNEALKKMAADHTIEFSTNDAKIAVVKVFNEEAEKDTITTHYEDRPIEGSKIDAVSLEIIKAPYTKNRALKNAAVSQKKAIGDTAGKPVEDEPLKKDFGLELLARSKERKEAITALFGADIVKPATIFTQINKHHQSDNITDVVTFIQAVGLDNLPLALSLIDKVGIRGKISEINSFYAVTKTVKGGAPTIPDINIFLTQSADALLTELTPFITEVGKHGNLVEILPVWAAAKLKNKVVPVTALFADGIIPVALSASTIEIGVAFAGKAKDSTVTDWSKLLSVPDWSKEELTGLALAFDEDAGGITPEQWVATAKKNTKLKTKPNDLRATARLDHFSDKKWYDELDRDKMSPADRSNKKYTQLLYALMGDTPLTNLDTSSFENVKGDLLSMLVFFNRHIAPFNSNVSKQGADRDNSDSGPYVRSNPGHPLNKQYAGVLADHGVKGKTLQPINTSLLSLQDVGTNTGGGVTSAATRLGATSYRPIGGSVSSAGLPSNNLKILQDQQHIIDATPSAEKKKAAKARLFNAPVHAVAPTKSRIIDNKATTIDNLADAQKEKLSDKISIAPDKSFHDEMLADRGRMVANLSALINSVTGGTKVMKAIGAEGHPSLLFKLPTNPTNPVNKNYTYCYDNKLDYVETKDIVPTMVEHFNAAVSQEVKITQRGSFGFQRPSLADTGDSVRFWPGYAPVEALLPGLKTLVEKLNSKSAMLATPLTNLGNLDTAVTDLTKPILHVEALKTAMRHSFIALSKKIEVETPPTQKQRVYNWLRTRLLIKLNQSELLIDKVPEVYGTPEVPSALPPAERNKHYLITADMTDKLQEYAMLLTAATQTSTVNPNADNTVAGKFKNAKDIYESAVVSKLGAADYRIYYLDSGEQALISAGLLANRFQNKPKAGKIKSSNYIRMNPYFEISTYDGDRRSNLVHNDATGTIVHADLSPVITGGIDEPKRKAAIEKEIRLTWQKPDVPGEEPRDRNAPETLNKPTMIPIIDITNSGIDGVTGLGVMPDNYIIVESLTKHQQLGADKFIMGRLIAVSKKEGTKAGELDDTNFLDLSQQMVGAVANEAFNPLLAQIRANMDKALYTNDMA